MTHPAESDPMMTTVKHARPLAAALIPQQRSAPGTSPGHDGRPAEAGTGRLPGLLADLVAVSLLLGIVVLAGQRSSGSAPPPPPPPGPVMFRFQTIPATAGVGIRPGGKALTGWLGCPPGSLEPLPALVPQPGPPPPAGCRPR